MVIHKHIDGVDTRFATMEVPLANNPLGGFLGVIIRGTHKATFEDNRWAYKPVYDLWPDIESDSDSIDDGSSDEGIKYQDNPYDQ